MYKSVRSFGNLKTVSSRLIRKEFSKHISRFYRKPVFWSGSYFVASCGGVTIDHLRNYVEAQANAKGFASLAPRC